MFRWPIMLTPLSLRGGGLPREAALEVTPRAAAFTLACLSHVGHPAHLALLDAYLKGQVRLTPTASIGDDSRVVAASLAVPLLAAHELGAERLTLADVILLEREERPARRADRSAQGRPTFTPDSPRLLLRAGDSWHWVRGAEHFEAAGCLGTRTVGLSDPWVYVVTSLPDGSEIEASAQSGHWPASIVAEVREPSSDDGQPGPADIARLRARDLVRFARMPTSLAPQPVAGLDEAVQSLAVPLSTRQPARFGFLWQGLAVEVSLTPDPDGYQTLCLLPPADADPSALFEPMRDLAWETIESLIGRPLPERRTEPIALRLVAQDGRSTTLDIGASVVIGRNQTVFTCWVGSDGRVMLKLFPTGGMTGR